MTLIKNPKKRNKTSSPRPKEDLTLNAHNAIRRMLLFNEIAIGQKIHYLDIAKQLNMSPTPVIQALKWMQFQGLVRHESNQGFYLEDISIDEVELLYEIRLAVEISLFSRSMKRLNETGIQHVKDAFDAFKDACQKKQKKVTILKDMEFHMALASLSGGRPGKLILQHIFDLLYLKYRTYLLMLHSGEICHQKIYDCIVNRDEQGAISALTKHIQGVGTDIVEQLKIHIEEREVLQTI